MKLTNGDVFQAREPLQKLMAQKLPVKTAYALAMLANKLNDQLKVLDTVRQGLIDKYAIRDKETGRIKTRQNEDGATVLDLEPDVATKFNSEFGELMQQTVEIVFERVKLPENVDGKGFEIEAVTLMALEKFVEV